MKYCPKFLDVEYPTKVGRRTQTYTTNKISVSMRVRKYIIKTHKSSMFSFQLINTVSRIPVVLVVNKYQTGKSPFQTTENDTLI